MDDPSIDDFFLRKPAPKKAKTDSPVTTSRTSRTPISSASREPSVNRVWADSIPRRPKEQPQTIKKSTAKTSTTPRSHPVELSSPTRSSNLTELSTLISSSTRKIQYPTHHRTASKPSPSPYLGPESSSRVLVPDSTDSPPSDVQSPPPHDSDVEFDLHQPELPDDPIPEKLFNSSPPPPETTERHINLPSKDKGKAREMDYGNQTEVIDEEEMRERLIAELGFEEEQEEQEGVGDDDVTLECIPFSSSPIEIIRPIKTPQVPTKMKPIESNSKNNLESKWSNRNIVEENLATTEKTTYGLEINEWENELTISSSFPQEEEEEDPRNFLASEEDQIKHIGLVIDDSSDEEGHQSSSGIAPLMDSWPAYKRGVFLKMAGLKSDDYPTDEAGNPQSNEDWDQLLIGNKQKKGPSSLAKKAVKKSWYNRASFRPKKRGSKSFRAVGKSNRRVK
ncbi:hypothetical protein MJO28_000490 [Puccinia striiformis f. sp. tritici]|uniref:Uncharacterized protein n=4 Tax=Puccinia striiformis TaxID=27350 RepID=A0A0L0URM3_9BASI|nr:hypothetical protein Pst134EA_000755 [Puccinia striiformis f. sp. tritici]KAI9601027.1 hypothetical protein H4Q26_000824 [Puccinia striiformis f. sp. tritici PST-130]KNE89737.1 hypothetical protein PSTG_16806 [Puccinia striiformis f. sp. tritici PST-78]POW14845.1 hypothetical protein PSHT_07287 [Puccinia striiformis]KAH9466925.1 hypothetical protein Pst134EB_001967 [Puccinia striiformis f. sp. tritici]KAH9473676.1 hypothetical protein Pst134EA_000755 [Puccinia striiformis f. sp. tritici]